MTGLTERIAKALRDIPSPIAAEECEPGFWRSCATWEQIIEKVAPVIAAVVQPSIDTAEQVDALPNTAVVIDNSGLAWQLLEEWAPDMDTPGWYCVLDDEPDADDLVNCLPARVLYLPDGVVP